MSHSRPTVARTTSSARLALVFALALPGAACAGHAGAPGAPGQTPPPLDLSGARVMLVPALAGSPAQVDAELAFWLQDRTPQTEWILPAALQAVADRTPAWRLDLRRVTRQIVQVNRDYRRVADPLYGDLRRLGAVLDADYALVPMRVTPGVGATGTGVALTAAFVDIRGGQVVWLGTVEGEAPDAGLPGAVAAAASALARALSP